MTDLYLIDEAIRKARYQLTLWTEEYNVHGPGGSGKSSMKVSDLRWLQRRIVRLEQFRQLVETTVNEISAEIEDHFA